ncbi:secretory phospholipase A2 receptor-like [Epinephelus fuscoguttatus]|uniref:secretory phospholipase A2 receptor-like n=1 Tax=Epinephelus fuscoguttatus TaxID=293821 RepID=UPI0020D15EFF|nr:secretory phospholipase A2 receptor-like [Epinephelus fuscoguttatus]
MWHWQWSLPGLEFNDRESRWHEGEPNDKSSPEKCVRMDNHTWKDVPCSRNHTYICYDERRQSNKTFHLIEDKMSWPQAQNYCREHHTDLVSGDQQIEDDEFKREYKSDNWVWIGLFRDSWRWSDGSSFSFRYRDLELFRDEDSSKKCAVTLLDGKWSSDECNKTKPFFCYGDKVILIKESKTWEEALNYCREKHCDLVSITNPHQQRWVQEKAKKADTTHVWLGLRYTCVMDLWFWVNDNAVCYQKWASEEKTESCDRAAAMSREEGHEWYEKADTETFNFICTVK